MLTLRLIYYTAASRATPGSRDRPITLNDGDQIHQGQGNAVIPGTAQNTARHVRARAEPHARGVQIQEQRPAAPYQRNNHNRYYENRYGNHGGGGGYRYGGGDYNRQLQQQNYMHGLPGAFYPGYGHCHLCGK